MRGGGYHVDCAKPYGKGVCQGDFGAILKALGVVGEDSMGYKVR